MLIWNSSWGRVLHGVGKGFGFLRHIFTPEQKIFSSMDKKRCQLSSIAKSAQMVRIWADLAVLLGW